MALSQFFNNLWEKVRQAPTFIPTYIEFTDENTSSSENLPKEFDDKKHYFMISVSEMFLSYQRLWHQNFSPMVFSVCNFKYDGKTIEIPYVIGPSHLKKFEKRLPKGMLFMNTPIVGIYPWRGGNVSLSLILSSVKEVNNIEKVLNVIEEVSNSLDFSSGIDSYTKIGRVVLKGFDSLLGFEQTNPLLGLNNNFGQAAQNPFRPGYFALIRADDLDKNKFWVKNKQLCYGDRLETAQPYRDDDFVLFKIGISEIRKDEESLGFYKDYLGIYNYIREQDEITEKQLIHLKRRLTKLAVDIKTSPDLTEQDADRKWKEKAETINSFVEALSKLDGAAPAKESMDPVDRIMDQALEDLKF
ncbi:MAG: hypothetical protein ACOCVA_01170 [Prolixibacteraceae bacterium]